MLWLLSLPGDKELGFVLLESFTAVKIWLSLIKAWFNLEGSLMVMSVNTGSEIHRPVAIDLFLLMHLLTGNMNYLLFILPWKATVTVTSD